ncbi:Uncharacterised protein [uncultured archaeon]|nr:Uncharacterised protein [uncultured archaeon]
MVSRALPSSLNQRISFLIHRSDKGKGKANARRFFLRGKVIDSRASPNSFSPAWLRTVETKTSVNAAFRVVKKFFGGRVRVFDVSRNYPHLGKLVVKAVHGTTASRLISFLNSSVEKANRMPKKHPWVLRKPHIYSLNQEFVAMAKTNLPSVEEIVSPAHHSKGAQEFFLRFARDNEWVTAKQMLACAAEASRNSGLSIQNLLFAGIKDKKYIFIPLADKF